VLVRRRVTRTYRRTAYSLQVLTLRDADGRERTLRVTGEHPFYVVGLGWTRAEELYAGQAVEGGGGFLLVTVNDVELHAAGVTVYNLEVEQTHTYFVLAEAAPPDAEAVWVHNAQYDIVPYRRRMSGEQKHHGVLNEWARHNIKRYSKNDAPAITLTPDQHNATRAAFNKWRYERTGSVTGTIEWSRMSPGEAQALSERMFDAAEVPQAMRTIYYRAFHQYIYTGSF
jgi:hypothetical protein